MFSHKEYCFPAFLSYEHTTPLNRDGKPMWGWESTIEQRDLTKYMEPTKNGCKMSLSFSGFRRKFRNINQTINLQAIQHQTFIAFNRNAICPVSRYIMNAGEMVLRNGKFLINIKVQKRTKFAGIILIFAYFNRNSSA